MDIPDAVHPDYLADLLYYKHLGYQIDGYTQSNADDLERLLENVLEVAQDIARTMSEKERRRYTVLTRRLFNLFC